MTQRPFLGGGDMTSLPGFGKLTDEEILDMRQRQALAGFQAQQKQIADLDITGIDFAAMDQDKKLGDVSESRRKTMEDAFLLEPEPLEPVQVDIKGPEYKGPISPFKALSAEAEIAGALLDMTPDVITNAVPIVNLLKWGQDFTLSSPEEKIYT